MKINLNKIMIISLLFASSSMITAQASGINVTPLRFNVSENNKMAAGHISNKNSSLLHMKTMAFEWSQENGYVKDGVIYEPKDVLVETNNIKFYPSTFVVKPGGTQTIRFQMNGVSDKKEFRVLFEELEGNSEQKMGVINFLTTISLPFFNYNQESKLNKNDISVDVVQIDGKNYFSLKNNSEQTLKLNKIILGDSIKDLGYYLQPNINAFLDMQKISKHEFDDLISSEKVLIETDKGSLSIQK